MKQQFIVLEGLDGSGKTTQFGALIERLSLKKKPVKGISFPDYQSQSSALIKMYLKGEIGGLDEVNVYAATSFYAADRYISYTTDWQKDYLAGKTIVADRYTTSNIIYQMVKLPKEQWKDYIAWIYDYEYVKLALPKPDIVIYLDVSPEVSEGLLMERYKGDASQKDLHEKNLSYLLACRQAALYAAEHLGWIIISCVKDGRLLSIEEISGLIDDILGLS